MLNTEEAHSLLVLVVIATDPSACETTILYYFSGIHLKMCSGSEEGLHVSTHEQMNAKVLNREQVSYDRWGGDEAGGSRVGDCQHSDHGP